MININRGFFEKARSKYRGIRGIMFVRKALAAGPDERQMEKDEEQPVKSRIELCDMDLVDVDQAIEKSAERQKITPESISEQRQGQHFWREVSSGGRRHQ